jgi:hypothetical protein
MLMAPMKRAHSDSVLNIILHYRVYFDTDGDMKCFDKHLRGFQVFVPLPHEGTISDFVLSKLPAIKLLEKSIGGGRELRKIKNVTGSFGEVSHIPINVDPTTEMNHLTPDTPIHIKITFNEKIWVTPREYNDEVKSDKIMAQLKQIKIMNKQ